MCHANDEMLEDDISYGHVATANLTGLWPMSKRSTHAGTN